MHDVSHTLLFILNTSKICLIVLNRIAQYHEELFRIDRAGNDSTMDVGLLIAFIELTELHDELDGIVPHPKVVRVSRLEPSTAHAMLFFFVRHDRCNLDIASITEITECYGSRHIPVQMDRAQVQLCKQNASAMGTKREWRDVLILNAITNALAYEALGSAAKL